MEEKVLSLEYVKTEDQLIDILIKALDSKKFEYLCGLIGMCSIQWIEGRDATTMHMDIQIF